MQSCPLRSNLCPANKENETLISWVFDPDGSELGTPGVKIYRISLWQHMPCSWKASRIGNVCELRVVLGFRKPFMPNFYACCHQDAE